MECNNPPFAKRTLCINVNVKTSLKNDRIGF